MGNGRIAGRVCAVKKDQKSTLRAQKQAREQAKKNKHKIRPETLEAAGYTFCFTTLEEEKFSADLVMELYRARWQVEIVFKRMKQLLKLGHLWKKDPQGAKAWIMGKLLVSVLIMALRFAAERFSPWGYRLTRTQDSVPLEGV